MVKVNYRVRDRSGFITNWKSIGLDRTWQEWANRIISSISKIVFNLMVLYIFSSNNLRSTFLSGAFDIGSRFFRDHVLINIIVSHQFEIDGEIADIVLFVLKVEINIVKGLSLTLISIFVRAWSSTSAQTHQNMWINSHCRATASHPVAPAHVRSSVSSGSRSDIYLFLVFEFGVSLVVAYELPWIFWFWFALLQDLAMPIRTTDPFLFVFNHLNLFVLCICIRLIILRIRFYLQRHIKCLIKVIALFHRLENWLWVWFLL